MGKVCDGGDSVLYVGAGEVGIGRKVRQGKGGGMGYTSYYLVETETDMDMSCHVGMRDEGRSGNTGSPGSRPRGELPERLGWDRGVGKIHPIPAVCW